MGEHDLSAGGDVMTRVRGCAQDALAAYGAHPAASVELINVSENATFLVTDPDTGPSVLRVHRLGYHTEEEIASELAWMDALRAEAGVRTPRVLPATDGRRVVTVAEPGAPGSGSTVRRHCVRFEFLPGTEPSGSGEPGRRGRRDRARAGRRAFRRAGRDHRADAPARPGMGPPGLVHPVPLGLRGGVRRPGPLGPLAGRHRRRAARARDPHPAGRGAPGPAAGVRLRAGTLRPGARRHPAGQPAGARRGGQRHRLRRRRVQLVPVRPGHVGELLRARAPGSRPGRCLAAGLPAGRGAVRRGRGGDLDVHHVPAAAAGRVDRLAPGPRTSPPSSAPGTRGAAATWRNRT